MAEYKNENGTTRVGDILRGLRDVGKPILEAAGGLSGQAWLSNIAEGIKTSSELDNEQKELLLNAHKLDLDDLSNARDYNARIQESSNSGWLAKNTGFLIDIGIILMLFGIVIALFSISIPVNNEEVAYMVLGLVMGYAGSVISFHRGSSEGSKNKTIEMFKSLRSK
jgi:hypothetical protein